MGFEVVTASLREAAGAAEDAADQLRSVDLSVVGDLAKALPGTRASGSATKVAEQWGDETSGWAKAMDGYAKKLTSAADAYDTNDRDAGDTVGGGN
ncbi:type VII secretion target [Saccharomonospora xinjiangensis]|uniref:Excreted virulence factor EspC, type VII ESX diderm n=1 Tax=Saccharomonospora xinjiangensis XJ-54 TaxID=882086 RepID=I0UZP1_9PSEU|nr:type VII secretion target [Saccharomonospora xinjiangensis]EID53344.1 Protein of unknown function (DUF2580) [Saccharomonospora xinjiangensis XJ-54]